MYKKYKNAKDRIKEMIYMLKQMAWNTFKNTGNINTFLELMEVQNIEKNMNINGGINGNYQDKGDNHTRK